MGGSQNDLIYESCAGQAGKVAGASDNTFPKRFTIIQKTANRASPLRMVDQIVSDAPAEIIRPYDEHIAHSAGSMEGTSVAVSVGLPRYHCCAKPQHLCDPAQC